LQWSVSAWLIVKLALVAGLVICHVLTGLVIMHTEESGQRRLGFICRLLLLVMLLLMGGILWLVLAKPVIDLDLEAMPWLA
ncbi:MAG: hypothetical protein EA349_01190, partial [Halomonadaceae bacterium]